MKIKFLFIFLLFNYLLFSQVGIGTTTPDSNTILDINANNKGVLFPRLTDNQRNAIVTPADGLFIYNIDNHRFEYFNGAIWMALEATPIATNTLFISEYAEGNSFDKYIEIYNPNSTTASLAGYELNLYTNGSNSSTTFLLSGTIAANDVFVIYHNMTADATILAQGDFGTSLNFNGNDAIELVKDGVSIDIIGIIGTDPGTSWTVAGNSNATVNNVIVRKPSITVGNTNWTISAGTNSTDSEWIDLNAIDFSNLGTH